MRVEGTREISSPSIPTAAPPAPGGTPRPITNLDSSLKEHGHVWPQAFPPGRFLYLAESDVPEKSAIYAATLARPAERVRLLGTTTNAPFASGGDGHDYLVWYKDGTLMAQEFDVAGLRLRGKPHENVNSARITVANGMLASASASGPLLFSTAAARANSLAWTLNPRPIAYMSEETGRYEIYIDSFRGLEKEFGCL